MFGFLKRDRSICGELHSQITVVHEGGRHFRYAINYTLNAVVVAAEDTTEKTVQNRIDLVSQILINRGVNLKNRQLALVIQDEVRPLYIYLYPPGAFTGDYSTVSGEFDPECPRFLAWDGRDRKGFSALLGTIKR